MLYVFGDFKNSCFTPFAPTTVITNYQQRDDEWGGLTVYS